jgi:hypothetical protein
MAPLRLPAGWGAGEDWREARSASISAGDRANNRAQASAYPFGMVTDRFMTMTPG